MTNRKIIIFHEYFLNTDILLIIGFIIMKICIHVAEDCWEGSVSQNFDIGPRFYCYVEVGILEKMAKNNKSFPFFVIKSKPGPK